MQALQWEGPRRLHVEELPEPSAGPGEVLIRSLASGICGSEVEGYLGRQANRVPPLVMGHEVAGVVIALGEGVADEWGGRLVAVNPIISCRQCSYCSRGDRNLCRRKSLLGVGHPGGFAEIFTAPASNLTVLPEGTDPRKGAFVEPLANGVHALRLALAAEPRACEELTAAVIGGGAIGYCVLKALVAQRVGQVTVVEPDPQRRSLASAAGAANVLADPASARSTFGNRGAPGSNDVPGADLVFDAVGSTAARQLAADLCKPHGCAILIGLHDDESPITFRPIVRDEVGIRGSYAYSDGDFADAARMVLSDAAVADALGAVHPLASGPELFESLAGGNVPQVRVFLGNG